MPYAMIVLAAFLLQAPLSPPGAEPGKPPAKPDRSTCFAFVDRDYIFTVEIVKPGVPLFNFVSMSDTEHHLNAGQVRLTLETRRVPAKFFVVDTGDPKEPLITPSLHMRPRSAFGVRLQGEFEAAKEILGAAVQIGNENFKLVPLSSFEFENLALKVNRLNLGSPDFRDDWRVLKLEVMGSREIVKRR